MAAFTAVLGRPVHRGGGGGVAVHLAGDQHSASGRPIRHGGGGLFDRPGHGDRGGARLAATRPTGVPRPGGPGAVHGVFRLLQPGWLPDRHGPGPAGRHAGGGLDPCQPARRPHRRPHCPERVHRSPTVRFGHEHDALGADRCFGVAPPATGVRKAGLGRERHSPMEAGPSWSRNRLAKALSARDGRSGRDDGEVRCGLLQHGGQPPQGVKVAVVVDTIDATAGEQAEQALFRQP